MDLKIKTIKVGVEHTNVYLIRLGEEAVLVDPADDAALLIEEIKNLGEVRLRYILLTHAHFDHVLALDELKASFPEATIVIHEDDIKLLHELPEQGIFTGKIYKKVRSEVFAVSDGTQLPFENENIKVVATPGHTKGSVCFLIGKNLFSGDTLFYHTYGRLDLPHSAPERMKGSLLKLLALPEITDVFPGHGIATTILTEKRYFDLKD